MYGLLRARALDFDLREDAIGAAADVKRRSYILI